ncbi:cellulose binding domain-containing protein [Cellulomonas dongxiuzhuiae]|uniref:Cellulose-binding domain-containing protein n=1 Tax=Cellulomonas dongxiuzhuiae TaxID=2819979 RepID=A0ABX8GIG4_9CELL|nr:cellulose binding domain-containing protein [Cellulomonas dongxiuzhuiae]MBO3094705.1 cellulose binding domain-containing protein [Cellulomonas dongxiuzhuiae]QWC15708.1 cellulose-binding domain-containing protein [Cellulomonas dongxiuzhuiae]
MTTRTTARFRALVAGLAAAALAATGLVAALTPPATALSPIYQCSVQEERTNTWSGGFVSELTIMMYVPVSEWTVEWTNSPTQRVTNTWNAQVSGENGVYSFRNVAWNGNVAAQGTFSFGFQGTSSGAWTRPTNITVNGIYCIEYMPPFPSMTPTYTTPAPEPTTPTPTPTREPTPTPTRTPTPTPSVTPTPTPTPTPNPDPGGCSGAFCDGFESQTGTAPAAPWTVVHPDCSGTGTASIDSSVAHSGNRSLRVNGAVGYCNHVFVQASGAVSGTAGQPTYVRFWVRHTTALPASHVTFLAMKDANDGNKDLRMGGQNGALQWNRSSDDATLPEQSPSGVALSKPLPTGQWACIEALVDPAGRLTTWLDGSQVTGLVADGTPTHDIDSQWHNKAWTPRLVDLRLGWESYGDGADTLWYDDVVVASSRTGC